MANNKERRGDEKMALREKELIAFQKKLMQMSKEERREFFRKQTNRFCDRNDEALRRILKS